MAIIVREALNADQMRLGIYCAGASKVGVNLTGAWVGSVLFEGSTDGLNFFPVFVTPFASGTTVSTATGNGNWETLAKNFVVFRVTFTRTSGTVSVTLGASVDSSYQDAFLGASSKYIEQDASAGAANVITVQAQVNRAWRLRTLSGGFSAAPGAAVKVTISDGASSIIWAEYVAAAAGQFKLNLPLDDAAVPGVAGGGVVGTAGNTMVITVAAPGGSVATSLSAEMYAA